VVPVTRWQRHRTRERRSWQAAILRLLMREAAKALKTVYPQEPLEALFYSGPTFVRWPR
jgi:hypothetical protein